MKALLKGIFWLTFVMAIVLFLVSSSEMGYSIMYAFGLIAIGFIGSMRIWTNVEDEEVMKKLKDPTYRSRKKPLGWVLVSYTLFSISISLYIYFR
ncbi:MAG: hypothetical protein V4604_09300 [Bacteroidota bacterium]